MRSPSALRALVPRVNSSTIAARTKTENVYATSPPMFEPAPRPISTPPATTATAVGQRRLNPSARSELRRQATSGPIPISNSSGSPKTRRKKLKYGGPTVIGVPRTASESSGKATPQSTVSAKATSSRLL